MGEETQVQKRTGSDNPIPSLFSGAKNDKKLAYLQAIETLPHGQSYQEQRKTAIEPVFSLLSELTATDNIVNYVNKWTYELSERSPNRDETNNSRESEFPRTAHMSS